MIVSRAETGPGPEMATRSSAASGGRLTDRNERGDEFKTSPGGNGERAAPAE